MSAKAAAAGHTGTMGRRTARRLKGNVFGPDGSILTIDNLPSPETERWVIRRKAEVVAAVCGGLLSFDDACKRYSLSPEEYISWQDTIGHLGIDGLRVTRQRDCPAQSNS